jgi:hypothetical protein
VRDASQASFAKKPTTLYVTVGDRAAKISQPRGGRRRGARSRSYACRLHVERHASLSRPAAQARPAAARTLGLSGLREIDWVELGKFPSWRKRPGRTAKRGRLIDSIRDG